MTDNRDRGYIATYEQARKPPLPAWDDLPLPCALRTRYELSSLANQKPTAGEVKHYRWWLDQELRLVHPRVVIALGSTAVLALAGKPLTISRFRGHADFNGRAGFITVHPSSLLRMPDRSAKEQGYRALVENLRRIRKMARPRL